MLWLGNLEKKNWHTYAPSHNFSLGNVAGITNNTSLRHASRYLALVIQILPNTTSINKITTNQLSISQAGALCGFWDPGVWQKYHMQMHKRKKEATKRFALHLFCHREWQRKYNVPHCQSYHHVWQSYSPLVNYLWSKIRKPRLYCS